MADRARWHPAQRHCHHRCRSRFCGKLDADNATEPLHFLMSAMLWYSDKFLEINLSEGHRRSIISITRSVCFTVIEPSLPSHAHPVAELKLPLLDKPPYSRHKRIHGE